MKKVVELTFYQPDERLEKYFVHLTLKDEKWHIAKVQYIEEDFSGRVLNRKEYYLLPTLVEVEDIESLDFKHLRERDWIDKRNIEWLLKLNEET